LSKNKTSITADKQNLLDSKNIGITTEMLKTSQTDFMPKIHQHHLKTQC